ncbi:Pyruvate:ferredoxin oxidoreductase, alpha subunit [invertebrate metagenome]|uniref:Pyruvate:ferredoxin oxidoreductase, alpha subunit n=1 Tax=invertebrate metagenome TaxID=1711999 RepID=A0A484H6D8_9ZZZZ
MLSALEGSQALARAVGLCRPGVVAAYPITPQTHIVENISKLVADGQLQCELVSVESEFSAASVALGAAAAGTRAYTASSSQGILLMGEVLYNISGLRVPMVLTCANRALGAPLNIWNDQQDSMAVRDAGWIQLYCADNQEAVDTTIQAFRIAERTEVPVMVCVDGFVLTHTLEPIDLPTQEQVDHFLPPYRFDRALDSRNPLSLGTCVDPLFFTESRHSQHQALLQSMQEIVAADCDYAEIIGRSCGGLLSVVGPTNAEIAILAMGSVCSTLQESMQIFPQQMPVKLIKLRAYRPLPVIALREALKEVRDLIVLERAVAPGSGGIVGMEVRSLATTMDPPPRIHNYAVGLGGRDVPIEIYPRLIEAVACVTEPVWFEIFDVELEKLPMEDR